MKVLVTIVRVLVGLLFIFSGLVKANDPLGLSYKMQEFFLVWQMGWLDGLALGLSIVMIAFEIIAGIALLLGWKPRLISWLLLLLIIFFTFLTGYAYLSGKFKNCGCFGDCIPITAGGSFLKDLFLLVLIVFLFFNRRHIRPLLKRKAMQLLMTFAVVLALGLQWYTLHYLPLADCLPFREGNNISQQMEIPADAVPDSTVIRFVYEKQGKRVTFDASSFPDDFDDDVYTFIERDDQIIRKGRNNEPPIKTFGLLTAEGRDLAPEILQAPEVLLLFAENAKRSTDQWAEGFAQVVHQAARQGIPVYIVTSSVDQLRTAIATTPFKDIEILGADNTMIRTAARTNPALLLLRKGTIVHKWSYKSFGSIRL